MLHLVIHLHIYDLKHCLIENAQLLIRILKLSLVVLDEVQLHLILVVVQTLRVAIALTIAHDLIGGLISPPRNVFEAHAREHAERDVRHVRDWPSSEYLQPAEDCSREKSKGEANMEWGHLGNDLWNIIVSHNL